MPDIDVPQRRQTIDVLAAVRGAQHRAVPLDEDARLRMLLRVMQRMDQMPPVGIEQYVTGCRMVVHVACLSRLSCRTGRLPLALAELAEIDRATVAVGGAAKKYVALHRAVVDGAFEAIGDGTALMARLELHAHSLRR